MLSRWGERKQRWWPSLSSSPVSRSPTLHRCSPGTSASWASRRAFFPQAGEALWQIAEHAWIYVVADTERAGKALLTILVEDLGDQVAQLAARGLEPARQKAYADGMRKITYRDSDGNAIGFGGAPPGPEPVAGVPQTAQHFSDRAWQGRSAAWLGRADFICRRPVRPRAGSELASPLAASSRQPARGSPRAEAWRHRGHRRATCLAPQWRRRLSIRQRVRGAAAGRRVRADRSRHSSSAARAKHRRSWGESCNGIDRQKRLSNQVLRDNRPSQSRPLLLRLSFRAHRLTPNASLGSMFPV